MCHDNVVTPQIQSQFIYDAFDSTGVHIVHGTFSMEMKDSTHISGKWHFTKVGNQENTGPQIGNGELVGFLENNMIHLNLNPKMIDGNVFLDGEMRNDTLRGTWGWFSYVGWTNWGTFTAYKERLITIVH